MIKQINLIGNEQLRKKARQCNSVLAESGFQFNWDSETKEWATHLIETALVHPEAVGLACSQIWDQDSDPLAMFVVKTGHNQWKLYINPSIEPSGKKIPVNESCLSESKKVIKVKRRSNVSITYSDLDQTSPKTDKYYLAVTPMPIIIQHEYDHLQGICLSDKR